MKIKVYSPNAKTIAMTFSAWSYKDLMDHIYWKADNYKDLMKNEGLIKHFKKILPKASEEEIKKILK